MQFAHRIPLQLRHELKSRTGAWPDVEQNKSQLPLPPLLYKKKKKKKLNSAAGAGTSTGTRDESGTDYSGHSHGGSRAPEESKDLTFF